MLPLQEESIGGCKYGKEGYSPARTVSSAYCNVFARFYAVLFEYGVQPGYVKSYVAVCVADAFVVGEGAVYPVLFDACRV